MASAFRGHRIPHPEFLRIAVPQGCVLGPDPLSFPRSLRFEDGIRRMLLRPVQIPRELMDLPHMVVIDKKAAWTGCRLHKRQRDRK